MTFADIALLLHDRFTITPVTTGPQPFLLVQADELVPLCQFLRNDDRLFFDLLACVTAIDNGPSVESPGVESPGVESPRADASGRPSVGINAPQANTMDVMYNLTSIPYAHDLMLKLTVPRREAAPHNPDDPDHLPHVPSLSSVWRTADWHEREAFDLVGIRFIGHPDLRRILLPLDWVGHPLRRDYQEPERYHGVSTK